MTRASKMLNKSLILSACFSFAALYAPQVAAAETPESGAARLSAMFAESLDFTLNQGGHIPIQDWRNGRLSRFLVI